MKIIPRLIELMFPINNLEIVDYKVVIQHEMTIVCFQLSMLFLLLSEKKMKSSLNF